MFAAGCVFMVGAILMTAANGHLGMIYAGRGIAGLGIGGCLEQSLVRRLTIGSQVLPR